jgi:hypothetical protein
VSVSVSADSAVTVKVPLFEALPVTLILQPMKNAPSPPA